MLSGEFSDGVDVYGVLGHKGPRELVNTQEPSRFNWDELAVHVEFSDCRSTYLKGDENLEIFPYCEKVPAKTLLLTGTPEGVFFNVLTLWSSEFYLGSRDVVEAYGTYLGITQNTIR